MILVRLISCESVNRLCVWSIIWFRTNRMPCTYQTMDYPSTYYSYVSTSTSSSSLSMNSFRLNRLYTPSSNIHNTQCTMRLPSGMSMYVFENISFMNYRSNHVSNTSIHTEPVEWTFSGCASLMIVPCNYQTNKKYTCTARLDIFGAYSQQHIATNRDLWRCWQVYWTVGVLYQWMWALKSTSSVMTSDQLWN